jgi:hypothetical protein
MQVEEEGENEGEDDSLVRLKLLPVWTIPSRAPKRRKPNIEFDNRLD